MKISVVIPIKNEESEIRDLIANLAFADEIIFIDTGSTDRSVQLAKEYGATVFKKPFTNFADVRNFGDTKAKGDWIISMDADMRITDQLKEEILIAILDDKKAFKIGRKNIIWGSVVNHTDWSAHDDCHIRLYPKNSGSWVGDVHEQYISNTKVKVLESSFIHYNYSSVEEYMTKMDRYSQLEVKDKSDRASFSMYKSMVDASYEFFKRYIYKLGFLDGRKGLALSYMQGVYKIIVGIKKYELESKK